jgi:hypothetical protein
MDTLLFHPKTVHLPIALALLMPLVAGGLALAWWRRWLPARSWAIAVALQAILVGSGLVGLKTGEAEEERVEEVVPERAIGAHERAAEAFLWASGVVFAAMVVALALGRGRAGLPLAGVAALGTVLTLSLGYRVGQAGGNLVYRYGAASVHAQGGGAAPPAGGERGGDGVRDDDD